MKSISGYPMATPRQYNPIPESRAQRNSLFFFLPVIRKQLSNKAKQRPIILATQVSLSSATSFPSTLAVHRTYLSVLCLSPKGSQRKGTKCQLPSQEVVLFFFIILETKALLSREMSISLTDYMCLLKSNPSKAPHLTKQNFLINEQLNSRISSQS